METLLAIVLPPIAVWRYQTMLGSHAQRQKSKGADQLFSWHQLKPAFLCTLLWLAGILPGIIFAVWFVNQQHPSGRHQPTLGRPNPFGSP